MIVRFANGLMAVTPLVVRLVEEWVFTSFTFEAYCLSSP